MNVSVSSKSRTDKQEEMHKLATDKGLNPSSIQGPGEKTRCFYVYDPNGSSIMQKK